MDLARALRTASPAELRERIVNGYPVDPAALEGWAYRGTSLGLPAIVQKVTWKTFQKTFYREPVPGGRLLGWNVRLEQDGIDAPSRPKRRDGQPVTEWHYEVVAPAGVPTPPGFDRGLIIDYSRGALPARGLMRWMKDPLVALAPDDADQLLGVSYLVVGGRCVETPTYFTLERDHPIDHLPWAAAPPLRPARRAIMHLAGFERRWAEALFEAIVPGGQGGLPGFADVDRAGYWRAFEEAAPPAIGAGLRAMVYTLTFLPVADRRFRRPFFALPAAQRAAFIESAARDSRYTVRQSVVMLKTLGCLAYFDDPQVRARFPGGPP